MSLDKNYDPKSIEPKWAESWVSDKLFHAREDSSKAGFSIVIPPPNVTGSLHVGHALNNTLQDILCRFHRMKGSEVLWMPGNDHAGIATQNVVERQLAKEGLAKNELGREEFVNRVWQWKEHSGGQIVKQLKRLGCSCDWERERFTMDEGLSRAVSEVFVRLFKEGLIYRDNYMINWCPRCESALADLEVDYPYEQEAGKLYRLRYPLVETTSDGTDSIVVDTTRPETMLGDTAVAVHPKDERYCNLIGKSVKLPLMGRVIPIIADEFVDPLFGSGAVKITPGHDPNDFEAGRRHGLEIITVIGFDGRMTESAGNYRGLVVEDCRKEIVEDLTEQGVLLSTSEHKLKIGRCYRCHTITQSLVSMQWFMNMKELGRAAAEAVRDGRTSLVPESWQSTYFHWLDNIRDWCISRQLWWGHQIPVWYCKCGEVIASTSQPVKCGKCQSAELRRDPDVLDTWFSSALWPFSTMGWPDKTDTLAKFYPTSVLVTGSDILFFWVARMMMMGLKLTGEVPFADVYLHAMVRDEHGQKMSKTKGNVIDPLEIIDEFGADALRFSLSIMTLQGRDINLSTSRIEGYRNFINKIWNAARYVDFHEKKVSGQGAKTGISIESREDLSNDLFSRWIRSRLAETIDKNLDGYQTYHFSDICTVNYRFFWDEFCAWYVEISKLQFNSLDSDEINKVVNNLVVILDTSLRLLHPLIPFVTEEIWHSLPNVNGVKRQNLMKHAYPCKDDFCEAFVRDLDAESEMKFIIDFVTAIRTIRADKNIPPGVKLSVYIDGDKHELSILLSQSDLISGISRLGALEVGECFQLSSSTIVSSVKVSVLLSDVLDVNAERGRIEKKMDVLKSDIKRLNGKLSSEAFLNKAPADVIQKQRQKLKEFETKLGVLSSNLDELAV